MATRTKHLSRILSKVGSRTSGLDKLLRSNYVRLTEELQAEKVIRYLIQEDILSIADKQEIMGHATSHGKAEALVDKLISLGKCTVSQFVDVLRRSGHGHLANLLSKEDMLPRSYTPLDIKEVVLCRLKKIYREEAEQHEGSTSLEGLTVYEMDQDNSRMWIGTGAGTTLASSARPSPSLVVKEEAGRQVGTALVADWVGDKKVTSDFGQVYKLKLNKVRKNQTVIDAIFDQLLHDPNYAPSFSKESLWNYMEQTQEEILFVLERLDRLNPFTSPEILQLIDKKLLPRATVIVTVAEANAA